MVATLSLGWRSGLGLAAGAVVAYLNFVWLHRGAELLIQRMLTPENAPSKLRLFLTFVGRYLFVLVAAYVILKGYPSMRAGFIVGLASPVLAAMCEGVYEAVVIGRKDQTAD